MSRQYVEPVRWFARRFPQEVFDMVDSVGCNEMVPGYCQMIVYTYALLRHGHVPVYNHLNNVRNTQGRPSRYSIRPSDHRALISYCVGDMSKFFCISRNSAYRYVEACLKFAAEKHPSEFREATGIDPITGFTALDICWPTDKRGSVMTPVVYLRAYNIMAIERLLANECELYNYFTSIPPVSMFISANTAEGISYEIDQIGKDYRMYCHKQGFDVF